VLIAEAHARGIKIIEATVLPVKGSFYDADDGEAVRDALNEWIRTSGEYDAVADLDRASVDPPIPTSASRRDRLAVARPGRGDRAPGREPLPPSISPSTTVSSRLPRRHGRLASFHSFRKPYAEVLIQDASSPPVRL
jgi:hypothetical protein